MKKSEDQNLKLWGVIDTIKSKNLKLKKKLEEVYLKGSTPDTTLLKKRNEQLRSEIEKVHVSGKIN